MLRICSLLVAGLLFTAPASLVMAQEVEDDAEAEIDESSFKDQVKELAKNLAKESLKRARRSIAIGPYVSAAPTVIFGDESKVDFQFAGGIGFYKFKIPILPGIAVLQEELMGRAKDRFKNQYKAALKEAFLKTGKKPTKEDVDVLMKELWVEIKKDLLMRMRPKTFEKPSFALRAEVGYTGDAEAWDLRFSGAFGVGPVFVVPSARLVLLPQVVFFIPAEVSLPIALGSGTRTTLIDLFFRYEFAAHGRSKNADSATLGLRFMFDAI